MQRAQRTAIERYMGEVEPIRLAVNKLLGGAANGELTDLPNTQAVQRAAIIRWRIGLTVIARAQLGWPRDFPIEQFPNAPLIIAFLAGAAAARTHDPGHAYLAAISFLANGHMGL
jgi:hypothetical protein